MIKRALKMSGLLALVGGAALGWTGVAEAVDQLFLPSSICVGTGSSNTNGAWLGTATGAIIWCGVGQDNNEVFAAIDDTNDDVKVHYTDNNATNAGNHYVVCQGNMLLNESGSSFSLTAARYSCSTAGGCSSAGTYSGSNYLTLTDIRHGATVGTSVMCTLPNSTGTVSQIKTIVLDEQ